MHTEQKKVDNKWTFTRKSGQLNEEYMNLLDRILKGAEYLANPLIKKEEYEKGIKLYDELCKKAWNYRWGGDENDKKHWYTETY